MSLMDSNIMNNFSTERLIREIRSRPAIWDVESEDYNDRDVKKKCWEELADIFGGEEITSLSSKRDYEIMLQRRWKGVRSCYTRELQRLKEFKDGSLGNAAKRRKPYIYFNKLKFLNRVTALRDKDMPVEIDVDEESNEEERDEIPRLASSQSHLKPFKRELDDTYEASGYSEPFISLNRSIEPGERWDQHCNIDEDRMFLLSLTSTLQAVPPNKKLTTKMKLMSVLHEAVNSDNY